MCWWQSHASGGAFSLARSVPEEFGKASSATANGGKSRPAVLPIVTNAAPPVRLRKVRRPISRSLIACDPSWESVVSIQQNAAVDKRNGATSERDVTDKAKTSQ